MASSSVDGNSTSCSQQDFQGVGERDTLRPWTVTTTSMDTLPCVSDMIFLLAGISSSEFSVYLLAF